MINRGKPDFAFKIKGFIDSVLSHVIQILSGNTAAFLIVILSAVQGIWYSLSFRPTIFDEGVHIGFIRAYSHQLSPFITKQPASLDFLGEVTRNPSYIYYYLMSWPLKLISLFSHSASLQVIFLRLINVAMFTGGIVLYRKLFINAGAPKVIANLALLFLILTPSIALLGGAVNYDNAIFTLSAIFMLIALTTIKAKDVSITRISSLIVVGLLVSLVKFEFLAIFVPTVIYICYHLWHKHRHKVPSLIASSFNGLSLIMKTSVVAVLVLSFALFVERPVVNILKYHNVSPSCTQIISQNRCLKNYTQRRNIVALANKPVNFSPINPFNYFLEQWIPGMVTTQTIIPPAQLSSAILRLFYYSAVFGGLFLIILYLRDFIKNSSYKFLLFVLAAYTLTLFIANYLDYIRYAQPVAITSRYLLPVMPIFILFVGLSLAKLLQQHKTILVVGLIPVVLIFTQGGGASTYLVSASSNYYWQNNLVVSINSYMKNHTKGFIRLSKVQ